jgi:peptidoglycan/xylan/chitin deacetylase (PgdA/CDA1 family)
VTAKRLLQGGFARGVYIAGRNRQDAGLSILGYHSIDEYGTPLSVSPRRFEEQMTALAQNGAAALSMAQVAEHLASGRPFPPRAVAVTFDDGFASVVTVAAPILSGLGLTATVYVITGMIGCATDWTFGGRKLPSLPLLTWPQLASLNGAGIEIGAHGVSHRDLTLCPRVETAEELQIARTSLESRLGVAVHSLAYPHGAYDPGIVQAARDAGYTTAVTVDQGRARPDADPLRLPRFHVGPDTSPAVIRSFLSPTIAPAYRLINLMMRRGLRRSSWPRLKPGVAQSTRARC